MIKDFLEVMPDENYIVAVDIEFRNIAQAVFLVFKKSGPNRYEIVDEGLVKGNMDYITFKQRIEERLFLFRSKYRTPPDEHYYNLS